MTTLQYTSDLMNDVLFRAGEPTDGSSDFNTQALEYLNRAYRALWSGGGELDKNINEPWLWLRKDPPGTLILNPIVDTGSVTVTNNSTTITFSSPPSASMANRFFKVDTHPDVFRISAHTASSATATLDTVYTGASGSGLTFRVFQLEYTLANDVLQIVSPMRAYANNQFDIDGTDLKNMDHEYPLNIAETGCPSQFAQVTDTKVRFNKAGGATATELIRVEYDYTYKPADLANTANEEPVVPLKYRQVLADYALFMLWTIKNDSRAEALGLQAKAGLQAMVNDNRGRLTEISFSYGKIIPRPGNKTRLQKVLRTTSGIIIG